MSHAFTHDWPGPRGRRHGPHRHGAPGWEDVLRAMQSRGPRGRGPGGPGGPGPHRHGRRRGPRARRGDVRLALLLLLSEEPRNGYGLMQEIEERSGGAWRPSPGSVYPALAQLEDEGLVAAESVEGGRQFTLTDAGRAAVEERDPEAPAPWEALDEGRGSAHRELREAFAGLVGAFKPVMGQGDEGQQARAAAVLRDARRALYRILAEDDEEAQAADPEDQREV